MTVELSRRRFIQSALASGAALSALPRFAFAATDTPSGDTLVLVVLRGGLDGLSALVPLGDGTAYHDARGGVAVPEGRALPIDDRFGLHPALAPLHELHQDGLVAFVPAAGSPDPSRSHFDQQAVLERGSVDSVPGPPGWLARHLAQRGATPLQAVGTSAQLPMVLHGAPAATAVPSLDRLTQRLHRTGDLASGGALLQRISGDGPVGAAAATSAAAAIGLLQVTAAPDDDRYPAAPDVRGLRDVARLLRAGISVDAAVVDIGGWDLHVGMGGADSGPMARRLTELANGLAAFHADTADLARPVTTVLVSEFGRTVAVNGTGGTDHGRGGLIVALGRGVSSGVFGTWPGLGADALDDGALAVAADFRDVLAEVVAVRLGGSDLATVFPGHAPTPLGLVRA